ncbi:G2/M phase-specific E3 ubiquitin-protein ligase-like [Maylandia zebra]|uniref:G2/M phase-specific E3 ubiquitin-protein ligase-like n=1 Tax=Maylandia zebra TaxID=106582 RepID=UPI00403C90A7
MAGLLTFASVRDNKSRYMEKKQTLYDKGQRLACGRTAYLKIAVGVCWAWQHIQATITEANEDSTGGEVVQSEMTIVLHDTETPDHGRHNVQEPEVIREEFYIDSAESEVSDLDEAVLASPERNDSHDEMDLATVLKDFQETHLDTSNYCTIIARRRKILHSACMALSKSYFAWHKLPNIEFVGEMADDYGGPRQEFFRLLMVETQNSLGIFEGKPGSLLFSYSQQLLSSNKFYTAGKLIAWSIAHNGPGPRCINRHLFCMMCGQKTSLDDFDVEVFMDEDIKQNIEKVSNFSTLEDLADLKSHLGDWIAGCGIPDIYTATLLDVKRIRGKIVSHFAFHRVASMIQQFVAGMDSCGRFWQMVKRCWKQFLPVFTIAGNKLTRNSFQDLFTIGWSPAGSDRREKATIFQWEWWLMAIQEQEVDHTFEELLVFITGADLLPPLGFPQSCNIDFYDQESGMWRFPYKSMCSLSLYLPRGVADEDQFKDLMNDALKGSLGFGKV